jgi:hypothetical protein
MRRFLVGLAAIGAAGLAVGCGGSAGKPSLPLDCAYLEGDNCWKTVASAAMSCLPGSSEIGTLSADAATCTYASGDVVTFTPPLVLPRPVASFASNFTVTTASGAACLSFREDTNGDRMTLTVQGQTVNVMALGGAGLALSCPDGASYSNAAGLTSCPDASLFPLLPAATGSSSSSIVDFSLSGTSAPYGSELIFHCQRPAS